MARKIVPNKNFTGLYYARESRHMSRSELGRLPGTPKQQLARLESGLIRPRLDHLKPFAKHLGYTPEQMLLWGKLPGTGDAELELADARRKQPLLDMVPELDISAEPQEGGVKSARKGRRSEAIKPDRWVFPPSYVRDQLHT